jgi:RNA polymerase sigma factor (sigma-70 family)
MTTKEFHYKLVGLQESLMRYAISLTADKEDAKDLVQETLLKALKYYNKFVYGTNFRGWTFTIMKNTFINNYNRSQRHNTFSDQTKEGYSMNYTYASVSDDPNSIYFSKEIEKIIEGLADEFRKPFKLHHAGFKYKEIAEKLDINIGTVKSRIFFSRKKLIKQLSL